MTAAAAMASHAHRTFDFESVGDAERGSADSREREEIGIQSGWARRFRSAEGLDTRLLPGKRMGAGVGFTKTGK
ncbi:MAG TPA: hypothetical protein VEG30_14690 [Terriglobales bacterium]|nr:hypothetical protein [Terriglobales bacterium]